MARLGVVTGAATNLIEVFDDWVARQPNSIALSQGRHKLSYSDLSERVSTMAARLSQINLPSGSPVVLRSTHELDTIAFALGAMRAGHPYALVDDEAAPATVVAACKALGQNRLLQITERPPTTGLASALAAESIGLTTLPNANDLRTPDAPLATIADYSFTSGTTGAPKILVNSHAYRLDVYQRWTIHYGIGPDDAVAIQSSFMYDAMFEVFVALTAGARAVLLPDRGYLNGADWFDRIRTSGVTSMMAMPSAVVAAIETAPRPIVLPQLKQLIFIGEPISARALAMAERFLPANIALHNSFGISEALLIADREIRGRDVVEANSFDFNTDAQMPLILTPVEGGERLEVSGTGVFDGYLGSDGVIEPTLQPWPTTDCFFRREDGSFHYAGRFGRTKKICGYLVSLEEVEGAFLSLPAVSRVHAEVDELAQAIHCKYDADACIEIDDLRDYLDVRVLNLLVLDRSQVEKEKYR